MKREIKFRGKNKKTGEWFYGNLYDKDISGRTHICTTKKGCLDIDPDTVGQYTGLKDKNGKEIYEGDIVKMYNGTWGGVVLWNSRGYFYVKSKYDDENPDVSPLGSLCNYAQMRLIVIGNIHDNPELIED